MLVLYSMCMHGAVRRESDKKKVQEEAKSAQEDANRKA